MPDQQTSKNQGGSPSCAEVDKSGGLMDQVLVCLIPGLDLRNLGPDRTPYISSLLAERPWAKLRTLPSPEHLSTIVTGQYPHHHEIWQARVAGPPARSIADRAVDLLPDFLTITGQAVLHQCFGCCDVPTIPPRRRRAFDFKRLKFRGRAGGGGLSHQVGQVQTVRDVLGPDRFRYRFTDRLHDRSALTTIPSEPGSGVDFVQFHALDMLGHWEIDTPEKFDRYYGSVDSFVRSMHEACERSRVPMVLMSDHGQERVSSVIDIAREIRRLDLGQDEFAYYLQPVMARFWCFTERARIAIKQMLGGIANGSTLSYQEMHELDVRFENSDFGELYFIPEPGFLLFPHDFHHPLVNFVFGLKDAQQRARLSNPRHIAYHGYLPHHPSETGFMTILGGHLRPAVEWLHLVDVMPSVLSMIGVEPPAWMDGRPSLAPS
jgi:hypothetical protein